MQNLGIKEGKLMDPSLTAFLLTSRFPIKRTTNEGRSMVFHFQETVLLEQPILDCFNGQKSVDARSLFQTLKSLKVMIFGGSSNGKE